MKTAELAPAFVSFVFFVLGVCTFIHVSVLSLCVCVLSQAAICKAGVAILLFWFRIFDSSFRVLLSSFMCLVAVLFVCTAVCLQVPFISDSDLQSGSRDFAVLSHFRFEFSFAVEFHVSCCCPVCVHRF